MDDEILAGKKLLIGLEYHSDFTSNKIFAILQNAFPEVRAIITYGQKDTIYAALTEKPDIIFLHFDSDPDFEAIIDMQYEIQEKHKVNCKLMVHTQYGDYKSSAILEFINGVSIVESQIPPNEVIERVSRCFQSKGVKVMIAMADTLEFDMMRIYIHSCFPGNQILYVNSKKDIHKIILDKNDLILLGFRESDEIFEVLDKFNKSNNSNILVLSPHEDLKDKYIARGANDFYLWRRRFMPDKGFIPFLRPYLGEFKERVFNLN